MNDAKTVFNRYLDAFTRGDTASAADCLTEDFDFAGPMVQVKGKAAFLEQTQALLPIVRGYEMLDQVAEGDRVCRSTSSSSRRRKARGRSR